MARDERENIQVSLDSFGSPNSWLQVQPRYKIDREGDRILSNTEVILKVAERPNEYIHCSEKEPPAGYYHEVNCSLESTAWRLSLFQSGEFLEANIILASQLVYIHDPETRSNITVIAGSEQHSFEVAIKPDALGDNFDSNNLWILESKKITKGGPVRWRKDFIRFRNLNTGKYLCMSERSRMSGNMAEYNSTTLSMTLSDSALPGTLFNLHELNSSSTHLTDGKPMQMSNGTHWVARGESNSNLYFCFGSPERGKGMNLLIHKYCENYEVTSGVSKEASSDPLDVFVGVAARNFLKKILDQTNSSDMMNRSVDGILTNLKSLDLDFFLAMTDLVIGFINGYPISSLNTTSRRKPKLALKAKRQKMICDQGALSIVMSLIKNFIPVSAELNISGLNSSLLTKSEKENNTALLGTKVLESCLNFVYTAVKSNPPNQMFVANDMSILLSHVGTQPLAAKCITEMLNSNLELQEEKIGEKEIAVFTDKLRSSKMNCMYLHLLQSCCSCNGGGVVGNQAHVSDYFFCDYNDVVISVHCDSSRRLMVPWKGELYVPKLRSFDLTGENHSIWGASLVTHGLPTLSLSWTTKHVDFSPLGLFGKLSITIEELYMCPTESVYSNQASSILHESKQMISKYFSAEMSLVAEMCLDRNYLAISRAEELFSYDILVTLVKLNVDEQLTAGAAQLLLRLYVDRSPQIAINLPCLSRIFRCDDNASGINAGVDASRSKRFALLQQLISEHVRDMVGKRWNAVSLNFMKLLNKLVKFGFYGCKE